MQSSIITPPVPSYLKRGNQCVNPALKLQNILFKFLSRLNWPFSGQRHSSYETSIHAAPLELKSDLKVLLLIKPAAAAASG
jgi:hypothetical protein